MPWFVRRKTEDLHDRPGGVGRNVAFTEAVTRCSREQRGHLSLPLGVLLEGSGRAIESVLADGRLDLDIADDVEVYRAELVLCRVRAPSRFGTIVAHDLGSSAAHPQGLYPASTRDAGSGRASARADTARAAKTTATSTGSASA